MGLYRDVANALERNGFYEGMFNEEYEYGVWVIPVDSSNANNVLEYWANVFDDELGGRWYADVELYFGKNPNPTSAYLKPDAVIIETF